MFSKPLLGTDKKKTTLNWWEYWIGHCYLTGFQSIRNNFITWMDLVWFEENQKHYTLLKDDIPFEQCYTEFWFGLNDDDVYPKEFLESLMQMADDVATGKVKTYPMDEVMDRMKDLVGDMIDDVDLNEKLEED